MSASGEQKQHALDRAAKVFAIVKQAAERGEACPTNKVLAERFGCRPNTISRCFNFLEAAGMVSVERFSDSRIVTIRATGKKTAGSPGAPHWSAAA